MMTVVNQDRVDDESGSVSETAKEEKMLPDDYAEKKWREKGDDDLKIVVCLRGRLLAERTASRVAKEEAELIGNKLIKLERRLKVEMESKNRAEKKLKFLKKKFESLNVAPISDQLSSSETSSGFKGTEDGKPDSEIAGSIKCDRREEARETKDYPSTSADSSLEDDASSPSQMHSSKASSCSVITGDSFNNRDFLPEEAGKVEEDKLHSLMGRRDGNTVLPDCSAWAPVGCPSITRVGQQGHIEQSGNIVLPKLPGNT